MKKLVVGLFSLVLSFSCFAETNALRGQKWIGPFTVDKVATYLNATYFAVTVHVNENVEIACEVSNHEKKFFYGSPNSYTTRDSLFSAIATAQAQNKRIMILVNSTCNREYGNMFEGVEILGN